MGSPNSEPGHNNNESVHQVIITRAYWMKAMEVTQAEWQSITGKNPSAHGSCGSSCPVDTVSWNDAIAYADALSARDNFAPCYQDPSGGVYDAASASAGRTPTWPAGLSCDGYRLPTEAEWEYAARAGTGAPFDTGSLTSQSCSPTDPKLAEVGWYTCNSNNSPHAVGTKRANPWGLFDMHGNVWEWVWDWYGPYGDDATDPLGAATGTARINRGGGWWSPAVDCRAAMRISDVPSKTFDDMGVRLVRTVQ